MGWTKRQFVTQAFEEIGLAAYVFDLQPEQMESAMRRLDAMMATWNGKGIRLGYPMPSNPQDSNLDTQTGVPDTANEAIYQNLAIKLAPAYGKTVSRETLMCAKAGYDLLLQRAAMPPERQFPDTLPMGAGNKTFSIDQPFMPVPDDQLSVGSDSNLDFL